MEVNSVNIAREQTEGVKTILSDDPQKAIIKMALPGIAGMSLQTISIFLNALWVTGLGPNALAAIGLFGPFFMLALGLSLGISIGGGAALSRKIGAGDEKGADNVAAHTLMLAIVVALLYSLTLLLCLKPLSLLIATGGTVDLIVLYGRIIAFCILFLFFNITCSTILRSEGDVKRSVFTVALGSVLNMILDPIFIYTLGLGLAGAALATMVSLVTVAVVIFYWFFAKKDTYVSITYINFNLSKEVMLDIGKVGLPFIISQISMALGMMVWNIIILKVAGTDGVAVFTANTRVLGFALIPILGLAGAVISVTAAAFGSRDFNRLAISYAYALKIGFIVEIVLATSVFLFAPLITNIINWSGQSDRIAHDLTLSLKITALLYPALVAIISGAMFQGVGKGVYDLFFTICRSFIFSIPLASIFSILFNNGLIGIWIAMVIANWIICFMAMLWSKRFIKCASMQYSPHTLTTIVDKDSACSL